MSTNICERDHMAPADEHKYCAGENIDEANDCEYSHAQEDGSGGAQHIFVQLFKSIRRTTRNILSAADIT
jgi:hypothetical protein